MSNNTLLVPIHVDALCVREEYSVKEAIADFTKLPYFDGEAFQPNDCTPNLSDSITTDPLAQPSLSLQTGVHLHWKFPKALTHGVHKHGSLEFPQLPNRWLVIYQGKSAGSEQYWVVESDYLYPEGEKPENTANIHYNHKSKGEPQPYRYLGRNLSLEDWRKDKDNSTHQYLDTLTVMGPFNDNDLKSLDEVKTTFTSLYAHCRSVFGFHHDLNISQIEEGDCYRVIGWYSNADNDPFKIWLKDNSHLDTDKLVEALKNDLQWEVDLNNQGFPQQAIYYGCVEFTTDKFLQPNPENFGKPDLIVGNSAAEALSAYLANSIDSENKYILEDQLEAIDFLKTLEGHSLDIGAKFKEIRHQRGFKPMQGGTIFAIKSGSGGSDVDAKNASLGLLGLDPDIAGDLNTLNNKAQAYYQASQELQSQRQILFADWWKYMMSKHTNTDKTWPEYGDIKEFIECYISPKEKEANYVSSLKKEVETAKQLEDELENLYKSLVAKLKTYNQRNKTQYILSPVPDLQYWQSNDPVVLMVGDSVKPTSSWFGAKGELICELLSQDIDLQKFPEQTINVLKDAISATNNQSYEGIHNWEKQPWNPVLLAWEVEFFPNPRSDDEESLNLAAKYYLYQQLVGSYFIDENKLLASERTLDYLDQHFDDINNWYENNKNDIIEDTEIVFRYYKGDNLSDDNKEDLKGILKDYYYPETLNKFYNLGIDDIELKPKNDIQFVKGANIYKGHSPLSDHASINLKGKLAAYLNKQLNLGESQPEAYLDKNIEEELQKCQPKNSNNPIYTALRAYQKLTTFNGLSQTLSGVNDGLLTYHRVMQLPVADPYEDYSENNPDADSEEKFTEIVIQQAVEEVLSRAPYPNEFNPIRGGTMRILNLRLIDTFGQVFDLKEPNAQDILVSEPLVPPKNSNNPIFLPPRLTQPAQLKFQWLSAADGNQEVNNSLPINSPICGWLLPNNLDDTLMVYDTQGRGLGFINNQAVWQPMPGSALSVDADMIGNPGLQQVVSYLLGQDSDFIECFISALDNALETIAPENSAQDKALALLMGRAIAVVRASVDLRVQGKLAISHNQKAMKRDLDPYLRSTNGFETVKFPIRIGEYHRFNDGLVGYWVEDGQGNYQDNTFNAPQCQEVKHNLIKTHDDRAVNLYQSVSDSTQILTLLLDPQGTIHATSGILPIQQLKLHPSHYSTALQNIEILFSTAPVLTEVDKVNISLPIEPGYVWSWVTQDRGNWSISKDFSPMETKTAFSGKQELIGGWLKLSKTPGD